MLIVQRAPKPNPVHVPHRPSEIFHKVADANRPVLQQRIFDAMVQLRKGVDRDALERAFEARDPNRVEHLLGLFNFKLVERRPIRALILKVMQEKGDEAAERLLRMRQVKKFEIYKANEAAKQTGVMVALVPPAGAYEQLAKYASPDERENLHMTLAYLGKIEDLSEAQLPWLTTIVKAVAHQQKPLQGLIQGVGRFNGSPSSDGKDVVWAHVDMPGLSEFRQKLVDELQRQGLPVSTNHGFTPHITLAYIDPGAPLPVDKIPSIPFSVDRVLIKIGEHKEVTAFSVLKGDVAGHEFHGNQYGGSGDHAAEHVALDKLSGRRFGHNRTLKSYDPALRSHMTGTHGWANVASHDTQTLREAHEGEHARAVRKGDSPGHPFHGNQWTSGGGLSAWNPAVASYAPAESNANYAWIKAVNAANIANPGMFSSPASYFKDKVVKDLAARTGLPVSRVNGMVASWAEHSSDHTPDSVAMQVAAAKFAGDTPGKYLENLDKQVTEGMPYVHEEADKMVRAMYDSTQQWLKDNGVENLYLFRGAYFGPGSLNPEPEVLRPAYSAPGGTDVTMGTSPLTSWTLNPQTAHTFAYSGDEGSTPYVFSAKVPADHVMSLPFTGIGALGEREVVVMGSRSHSVHATHVLNV